ncbi:MAG: hypothetical protein HYT85_08335 [candidate division NC10 bacterium]|nr:hypothetical protein [candidate division NC10 bacterium]
MNVGALPGLASPLIFLQAVVAAIPDPDPIPLPAPTGVFVFLLVLTFLLHLLAMNFVLGGSLMMVFAYAQGRMAAEEIARHHRRLIEILARAFPATIAFTITLGVAPLLFIQVLYGQLFFSSSILMAWPWLAVVGLLLVGYYAAYWHAYRHAALGQAAAWVALFVAATFLLIAFLFVNNFSLLQNPEAWRPLYLSDRRGVHLYAIWDAGVFPRYLHFGFAALAMTGLVVAMIGLRRRAREPEFACWTVAHGGRWFLGATVLQMASGLWLLSSQPARVRDALLGGNSRDALLLAVAVGCALVALAVLAPPSRISAGRLVVGSAAIGVTVVLMVLLRQRVRTLWLEPYFRYEQLPVAPQWGAILVFLGLLAVGISLVGWMVWQFFWRSSDAPAQT